MNGWVKLGRDREGNIVWLPVRTRYNITIVEGSTGSGKTQIVRNIYTCQATFYNQPLLILDYGASSEHKLSKFANFKTAETGFGIPNLSSFSNVVFKISQFDRRTDWQTLGLPPGAALFLSKAVVEYKEYHQDSFEKFYELMKEFPNESSGSAWWYKFEQKYGFRPSAPVNRMSQNSIVDKLIEFDYIFWTGSEEEVCIENWGELLRELRHIHVDLGLKTEDPKMLLRARAVVGKILQHFDGLVPYTKKNYIEYLHPLIVVEEADRVFPYPDPTQAQPSSSIMLERYINKLQKFGMGLILVTQNVRMLHPAWESNYQNIISGPGGGMLGYGNKPSLFLNWDIDTGVREFALIRRGKNWIERFKPIEVPCLLPPTYE